MLKKLCCCCPFAKSKSFKKANKLTKLFAKGQAKLAKSLDITKFIEMVQRKDLVEQAVFGPQELFLLDYQRDKVIGNVGLSDSECEKDAKKAEKKLKKVRKKGGPELQSQVREIFEGSVEGMEQDIQARLLLLGIAKGHHKLLSAEREMLQEKEMQQVWIVETDRENGEQADDEGQTQQQSICCELEPKKRVQFSSSAAKVQKNPNRKYWLGNWD